MNLLISLREKNIPTFSPFTARWKWWHKLIMNSKTSPQQDSQSYMNNWRPGLCLFNILTFLNPIRKNPSTTWVTSCKVSVETSLSHVHRVDRGSPLFHECLNWLTHCRLRGQKPSSETKSELITHTATFSCYVHQKAQIFTSHLLVVKQMSALR